VIAINKPVPLLKDPDTESLTSEIRALPQKVAKLKAYPARYQPVTLDFQGAEAQAEPGIADKALRFPVKSGGKVPIPMMKGEQQFTVSFWVKADKEGSWDGGIVDVQYFETFSLDIVQAKVRLNAQGKWFYGGTNPMPITEWTHLAVTCDGSIMRLYRDGRLVMALPGERPLHWPAAMTFGAGNFRGVFDGIAVYKTALPADEVERLYLTVK